MADLPHIPAMTVSLSEKHQWGLSNCVFANTVYSPGNPIITFLLPFCLSLILSFWKGPFKQRGPFYLTLKGFKPAPLLLNGWERAVRGFLWVTQLAMERSDPASFTFSFFLMAGQPRDFHAYTPASYCHAKQRLLLQPHTTSHRSLKKKKRSPSVAMLCPTATNACNFCANDEPRLRANTTLSAPAIIGFGPYGGTKTCNCGPLRKQS